MSKQRVESAENWDACVWKFGNTPLLRQDRSERGSAKCMSAEIGGLYGGSTYLQYSTVQFLARGGCNERKKNLHIACHTAKQQNTQLRGFQHLTQISKNKTIQKM